MSYSVTDHRRNGSLSRPITTLFAALLVSTTSFAQSSNGSGAVIVRPGAPGQPSAILSASTKASLPPVAPKDVEFMRGMIMHHAQAVEMAELIEPRTQNKEIRLLGAKISQSQADEMKFMRQWLETRGMPAKSIQSAHNTHGSTPNVDKSMPGMLTPEQMEALRNSKGSEFDRLFLTGMIHHHNGALAMVKDLFDTAGSGQDAELFNFASDVDSGQRAEIKTMRTLLGEKP